MVLVKKLVDSLQCIKVCSIESEFGHKEHVVIDQIIFLQFFLRRNYPVQDFKRKLSKFVILDNLYI